MAEEKIVEEHKHVVTETEEGKSESHYDKVVDRDKGEEKPKVIIERETTIEETE